MDMELISPRIRDYLLELVPPRPEEMLAMEAEAGEKGFPIIGPVCGHLCYQISRMMGARQIFELGSGYGYSTAWLARGVRENGGGVVHHVVWDEELSREARGHLAALGLENLVRFHVGEAVQSLEKTPGGFDLIFSDIDKEGYPGSLPTIKRKLRTGGVLIIDNMLWSGRILDEADQSPDTRGVREFTRLITEDPDWITSLVPIRDGMIIALKI